MADLKREDILEWVKSAPALELAELVKEMEEVFGVSAAAPVAVAAAAPADKKIQVIKVVRELDSALGLKEAKDLVDAAPKAVLTGVNKEKAEEAKTKLEEAGASVELK